jgi:hypothetical protein
MGRRIGCWLIVIAAVSVAACSSSASHGTSGSKSTVEAKVEAACNPIDPTASGASMPAAGPVGSGRAGAVRAAAKTVRVDMDRSLGPVNEDLLGLVWNDGNDLSGVAAIHPPTVRVDASLQDASTGPNRLDLQPLLARVAEIRRIGAEPLVLLSYMPRWLGRARAGTHDPTRVAPADLDAWQALITTVVRTLATAKEPAYIFEVWNEPDISVFWQDTPAAFVQMAVRTTLAVERVKRETGKPLEVGGPAAAFGGLPDSMVPYLKAVATAHLPLDFYSWHRYANTPYLGPDGAEGNLPADVYKALAKRNPTTTPLDYAHEISQVKLKVAAALAGSGLAPKFLIDEWNVSGGGYDLRHDDAEGAALDAGILIEMERSGLDGADFYRAVSGSSDHPGDWGMVTSKGAPKPAWWVFRAWDAMEGSRLATRDDPAAGVWARATREARGCVDVLLANFVATGSPARDVTIGLDGKLPTCTGTRTASLAVLDRSSKTLGNAREIRLNPGRTVDVPMAPQSVALVRIGCRA